MKRQIILPDVGVLPIIEPEVIASENVIEQPVSRAGQFFSMALFAVLIAASAWLWQSVKMSEMFVVRSGSMEPTIATGAIISVKPQETYQAGEVITFRAAKDTITHRIVEVVNEGGETWYKTKGDANHSADHELVASGKVVGAVDTSVPYFGYVLRALRTRSGFAVGILLPATLILLQEMRSMRKAWLELKTVRWGAHAALTGVLLLVCIPTTGAILKDSVEISNITISTAVVFPTPSPTPIPTPVATPTPTPDADPDPCSTGDHDIEQSNNNTGEGSTNENIVEIDEECEVIEETETNVSNDVNVETNTGGNTSSGNTDGGSTTTGDATVNFRITNIVGE